LRNLRAEANSQILVLADSKLVLVLEVFLSRLGQVIGPEDGVEGPCGRAEALVFFYSGVGFLYYEELDVLVFYVGHSAKPK